MTAAVLGMEITGWPRLLAGALAVAVVFGLGVMQGERVAGQQHVAYVAAQAAQSVKIAQAQAKVVVQTEIKYRDRIQKVYVKGNEIEKQVPVYVTAADNLRYGVNVGFVRSYNAAWSGDVAGPAAESDREPAGIPLADIAETDAANATSCRAWREQAIGMREFYEQMKASTNNLAR